MFHDPLRRQSGTVTEFDEARGLGIVTSADAHWWPFHCTAIAGGTRSIAVGTNVTFSLVASHLGRWEATELAPVE